MKQIRVVQVEGLETASGRFSTAWMEASTMNRWLLKARLVNALATYGPASHWIETRNTVAGERAPELQPLRTVGENAIAPLEPYMGRARAI